MNKQKGYFNADGLMGALAIFFIIIGCIIYAIASHLLPWIWDIIKPILHEMTK